MTEGRDDGMEPYPPALKIKEEKMTISYWITGILILGIFISGFMLACLAFLFYIFRDREAYPFTRTENLAQKAVRHIDRAWLWTLDVMAGTKHEIISKRKIKTIRKGT